MKKGDGGVDDVVALVKSKIKKHKKITIIIDSKNSPYSQDQPTQKLLAAFLVALCKG
jgi:predicted patatin/cPLA2 family phospholipase